MSQATDEFDRGGGGAAVVTALLYVAKTAKRVMLCPMGTVIHVVQDEYGSVIVKGRLPSGEI